MTGHEFRVVESGSSYRAERFRDENENSSVFVIGNISVENATRIDPDQVGELFFPNASTAYTGETRGDLLAAAEQAIQEDRPIVFDSEASSFENVVDVEAEEPAPSDRLVIANVNESSSALAPRRAVSRNASLMVVGDNSSLVKEHLNDTYRRFREAGVFRSKDYFRSGFAVELFGAPTFSRVDPTDAGGLLSGEVGGSTMRTDSPYWNTVGSPRHREARVTRYTGSSVIADHLLTTNRTAFTKATVAGAYRHDIWPTVLANGGGGLWQVDAVADELEEQNVSVRRLVERRTDTGEIGSSLMSLVLVGFGTPPEVKNVVSSEELIETIGSADISSLMEQVLKAVRTGAKVAVENPDSVASLTDDYITAEMVEEYGPSAVKILSAVDVAGELATLYTGYLEHELQFDEQKAATIGSNLTSYNDSGNLTTDIVEVLLRPYRELNETSLRRSTDADLLYYTGSGNETHWILPNRQGTHLESWWDPLEGFNQYNGSRRMVPNQITGFVYSSSPFYISDGDNSIHRTVLYNGTGTAGFRGEVYPRYAASIGSWFVEEGSPRASNARQALNRFYDEQWIYDPALLTPKTAYQNMADRKNKTASTFTYFGRIGEQREMEERTTPSYNCTGSSCSASWTFSSLDEDDERTTETTLTPEGKPPVTAQVKRTVLPSNAVVHDWKSSSTSQQVDGEGMNATVPVQPVQVEQQELPGNRTELVVRHATIQRSPDGVVAFEDAEVEANVSIPFRAKVDQFEWRDEGLEVETDVESMSEQEVTAIARITNNSFSETVEKEIVVENGTQTLESAFPVEEGKYDFSIVFTGDIVAGPYTREIRPERTLNVSFEAPEKVRRTEPFTVSTTVSNPTDETEEIELWINKRNGVQPQFLRAGRQTIALEPGTSKTVMLPVQAFLTGEKNLTVSLSGDKQSNRSIPVTVDPRRMFVERAFDAVSRLVSFTSTDHAFSAEVVKGEQRIEWKRPSGRLRLVTGNGTTIELETARHHITVERWPGNRSVMYRGPDGTYRKKVAGGSEKTVVSGIVKEETVERWKRKAQREAGKAINRYRWERSGGEGGAVIG